MTIGLFPALALIVLVFGIFGLLEVWRLWIDRGR